MTFDYESDLRFVSSILAIANKYDSDYLRDVVNRLNYIIEERKRDGKYERTIRNDSNGG